MAVCVLTIMCTGVDKTATSTKARLKDKKFGVPPPPSFTIYLPCTLRLGRYHHNGGQVNVRNLLVAHGVA